MVLYSDQSCGSLSLSNNSTLRLLVVLLLVSQMEEAVHAEDITLIRKYEEGSYPNIISYLLILDGSHTDGTLNGADGSLAIVELSLEIKQLRLEALGPN